MLWSPALHEALFIFSITSSWYRVATAKTQRRFSIIIAIAAHVYIIMHIPHLCNYCAVWKFQWHKSLMRLSPDPFPIFEGGVRQCQTRAASDRANTVYITMRTVLWGPTAVNDINTQHTNVTSSMNRSCMRNTKLDVRIIRECSNRHIWVSR